MLFLFFHVITLFYLTVNRLLSHYFITFFFVSILTLLFSCKKKVYLYKSYFYLFPFFYLSIVFFFSSNLLFFYYYKKKIFFLLFSFSFLDFCSLPVFPLLSFSSLQEYRKYGIFFLSFFVIVLCKGVCRCACTRSPILRVEWPSRPLPSTWDTPWPNWDIRRS